MSDLSVPASSPASPFDSEDENASSRKEHGLQHESLSNGMQDEVRSDSVDVQRGTSTNEPGKATVSHESGRSEISFLEVESMQCSSVYTMMQRNGEAVQELEEDLLTECESFSSEMDPDVVENVEESQSSDKAPKERRTLSELEAPPSDSEEIDKDQFSEDIFQECFGIRFQDLAVDPENEQIANSKQYIAALQAMRDIFGDDDGLEQALALERTASGDGMEKQSLRSVVEAARAQQSKEEFAEIFGAGYSYDPSLDAYYGMKPLLLRRETARAPPCPTGKVAVVRLPSTYPHRHILHLSANRYVPSEETLWKSNFRNVYTPENIIRCARKENRVLSNTRYVTWDNGDVTLHIGRETHLLRRKTRQEDPHLLMTRAQFSTPSERLDKGEISSQDPSSHLLRGGLSLSGVQNPISVEYSHGTSSYSGVACVLAHEARQRSHKTPALVRPTIPPEQRPAVDERPRRPPRPNTLVPAGIAEIVDPLQEMVSESIYEEGLREQRHSNVENDEEISPILRNRLREALKQITVVMESVGVAERTQLEISCAPLYQILENSEATSHVLRKGLQSCEEISSLYHL